MGTRIHDDVNIVDITTNTVVFDYTTTNDVCLAPYFCKIQTGQHYKLEQRIFDRIVGAELLQRRPGDHSVTCQRTLEFNLTRVPGDIKYIAMMFQPESPNAQYFTNYPEMACYMRDGGQKTDLSLPKAKAKSIVAILYRNQNGGWSLADLRCHQHALWGTHGVDVNVAWQVLQAE